MKHTTRILQTTAQRRIFTLKKEEGKGICRKLKNENINNLHSSSRLLTDLLS
jgi:hypothetical protein